MQRKEASEKKAIIEDSHQRAVHGHQITTETKEIAKHTLDRLNEQGEQIDRIQHTVDNVGYQQEVASRHISSISNIFSTFFNWIRPATSHKSHIAKKDKKKKKDKKAKKDIQLPLSSSATTVKFLSLKKEEAQQFNETNRIVGQIGEDLDDLHEMSVKMGETLDHQNQSLKTVEKTTVAAEDKMVRLQGRVRHQTHHW